MWNDTVQGSMCNLTGDLNWYDLYRPKYHEGLAKSERVFKSVSNDGTEFEYVAGRTFREYTPFLKHMMGEAKEGEKEFVMETNVTHYFNNDTVKKGFHLDNFTGPWHQCIQDDKAANGQPWAYHVQPEASLWIYPILKAAGIRILFYSGDTDGAVGLAGTRQWIKKLNWPLKKQWTPWATGETKKLVRGYVT